MSTPATGRARAGRAAIPSAMDASSPGWPTCSIPRMAKNTTSTNPPIMASMAIRAFSGPTLYSTGSITALSSRPAPAATLAAIRKPPQSSIRPRAMVSPPLARERTSPTHTTSRVNRYRAATTPFRSTGRVRAYVSHFAAASRANRDKGIIAAIRVKNQVKKDTSHTPIRVIPP